MTIQEIIEEVEHQWLDQLYDFCRSCFSTIYLPSHDESHHLRTWHFSRELIPGYDQRIYPLTKPLIEGTLIAAMLHDTGMSETIDFTHGRAGRRLAESFLSQYSTPPVLNVKILEAIEKHDDKNYSNSMSRNTDTDVMLSLLSLADDMDAFGAIGVFRYYEIYTLRGIPVNQLAVRVLPNLENRYKTMAHHLQTWPGILTKQKQRYRETRQFFEDLGKDNSSTLQVIHYFEEYIRILQKKPEQVMPGLLKNIRGKYALDFFTGLQNELSSFPDFSYLNT